MEILDGKYVSNNDKNLYVKILGEGSPAVVIEPNWGSLSVEWEDIQRELAKHTTVISYDRAGYAESPVASNPRSSMQIATELYTILMNSGIKGPYILVGHAGGGLYVQHFLKLFANETAGLVLVDSISQNDLAFDELDAPKYQEIMSVKTQINNLNRFADMKKEEFESVVIPLLEQIYQKYPDYLKHSFVAYQSDQTFYKTVVNELKERKISFEHFKQLSLFTNIPVIVLCHDYEIMIELTKNLGLPEEEARIVEELWLENSKDLMNLSTDSEFRIIKDSTHNIHIDKPKAVIDAVLDVIKKIENE